MNNKNSELHIYHKRQKLQTNWRVAEKRLNTDFNSGFSCDSNLSDSGGHRKRKASRANITRYISSANANAILTGSAHEQNLFHRSSSSVSIWSGPDQFCSNTRRFWFFSGGSMRWAGIGTVTAAGTRLGSRDDVNNPKLSSLFVAFPFSTYCIYFVLFCIICTK